MRFVIGTSVLQRLDEVMDGFNEDLFLKLNPPFPPVRLIQFDGCSKGDVVELELNFLLFKQIWKSLITEDNKEENEFYFIDEGVKLPFFLKYWRHKHQIVTKKCGTTIVDDITFKTPLLIFDILMFPLLYFQFLYRKPVYKKVFGELRERTT